MSYHLLFICCILLHQVPANHLLTASVMAAPAALAMSKLSYPELAVSKTSAQDVEKSLKNVQVPI